MPAGRAAKPQVRCPGLVALFPCDPQQACATWAVRGSTLIGRAQEAGVRIEDPMISRRQAQLESVADGLRVSDLGSRHGTFVDGKPLGTQACIAPFGSVLRAGGVLLLVVPDIAPYAVPLRRIAGSFLGLQCDVIAGPELRQVWQQAAQVAALSHPVLILGESGSARKPSRA